MNAAETVLGWLHIGANANPVVARPGYGIIAPTIVTSNGAAALVANHISVGVASGEYDRWEPAVDGLDWTADEAEMTQRLRAVYAALNGAAR